MWLFWESWPQTLRNMCVCVSVSCCIHWINTIKVWSYRLTLCLLCLQRNDIAMAITKFDQFDFLIDIVPRDDLKPPKRQVGKHKLQGCTDGHTASVVTTNGFWKIHIKVETGKTADHSSQVLFHCWQPGGAVNILDWKLGFGLQGLSVGCLQHLIASDSQL